MPTIRIDLFEGRTREQKHELMAALTQETVRVLGCPPDSVEILITEMKREDWSTAGIPWSER